MKKSNLKPVENRRNTTRKSVGCKRKKVGVADIKKLLAIKLLAKKIQERKNNNFSVIAIETFIISNYKLKS